MLDKLWWFMFFKELVFVQECIEQTGVTSKVTSVPSMFVHLIIKIPFWTAGDNVYEIEG